METTSTSENETTTSLTLDIARLDDAITTLEEDYKISHQALARERTNKVARRRALAGGLDLKMMDLAESVLRVEGMGNWRTGDCPLMIRKAVADLTAGAPMMSGHQGEYQAQYFYAKNYERWRCQGGTCDVGMVPTHGSVVFRIELRESVRQRPLTPEEIDAAISYLVAIEQVYEAKQAARG